GVDVSCPIAFSPDGKFLARGIRIALWALADMTPRLVFEDDDEDRCFEAVAFSPNGGVLAAQGTREPLRRWAVDSGKPLPGGWGVNRGESYEDRFPGACVAYAPGGDVLATSFGVRGKQGYDSVIYLWDAETGDLRGQVQTKLAYSHPTAITFSP
ncbi:WD40 repeat domain-containing protein, partial [Pseudomonas sp. EL_65y_Pfl1_R32]|uniref:WD40 repeat domain-containing protein n=1 Tax=Pseudomonas sp. EL_65y_Pfl1_R32 TaxID=3088696 RepID=UPI0030D7E37C